MQHDEWQPDIGHLLRETKRRHGALKDTPTPGAFTAPQFVVLLAVSRVPGIDQRTAGALASLDQATVSEVVRRLAKRDLLIEEADPNDGRRKLLTVSPAALEQVRADSAKLRRADEAMLASLSTEDGERLVDLLARIAYASTTDPTTSGVTEGDEASVFTVAETSHALGRVLRIANQLHTAIWRDLGGGFITPPQYSLLTLLESMAPMSQSALSAVLALNKGTVTDLVSRLERNGLVTTTAHPTDRRQQIVSITPSGHGVLKLATHAEAAVRAALLAPVADSGAEIDRLLTSVLSPS